MNSDDDVITMSRQRLIDRVIDDLEHHMMQACSIGGIADVHAWTLTHSLKALEHLDRVGAVCITIFGDLICYLIIF